MLVSEAAKKLGMNPQTLRLGLQQGKFSFGTAILTTKAEDSKVDKDRYTYYINERLFENYLKGVTDVPQVFTATAIVDDSDNIGLSGCS